MWGCIGLEVRLEVRLGVRFKFAFESALTLQVSQLSDDRQSQVESTAVVETGHRSEVEELVAKESAQRKASISRHKRRNRYRTSSKLCFLSLNLQTMAILLRSLADFGLCHAELAVSSPMAASFLPLVRVALELVGG